MIVLMRKKVVLRQFRKVVIAKEVRLKQSVSNDEIASPREERGSQ